MYVCLCNAVSDKVIRKVVRQYHLQSQFLYPAMVLSSQNQKE
jgi:bacterioferritin-associated ferredoxin